MKWGIIGAMPSEVSVILRNMVDVNESKAGCFTFYEGKISGVDATLVQCGIGKVNAAMVTQILIDRYHVTRIVNTGIAGAIRKDLKIMDVVVSRDVCYHDFNSRFLREYVPFLDKIEADNQLVEAATKAFESIDHGTSHCFTGRIATGDQFVESSEVKKQIVEQFDPLCVEMEGAAIGHTCAANGIPFVIIRTMSDNADENAGDSATNFEEVTTRHSSDIVLSMLRNNK